MSDVESPTPTVCPYEGEREVRSLYLAGRLPEAEAEAFERHYFGCAACAEAIEVGTKLRMAFENPPVRPAAGVARATGPRIWISLAAAAAATLIAVGLWQASRRGSSPETPSVLRSGTSVRFRVRVETAAGGSQSVSWTPEPGAARYVVRVLTSDARSVWSRETSELRVEIDAAALPPAIAPLEVQVEALDTMERVVATSEPAPLTQGSR